MRGNQNQKHTQFYMHTDISRHFCVANITERIGYGIIHKVNTTTVKYETANLFFFLSFLFFFFCSTRWMEKSCEWFTNTHHSDTTSHEKKRRRKIEAKNQFQWLSFIRLWGDLRMCMMFAIFCHFFRLIDLIIWVFYRR